MSLSSPLGSESRDRQSRRDSFLVNASIEMLSEKPSEAQLLLNIQSKPDEDGSDAIGMAKLRRAQGEMEHIDGKTSEGKLRSGKALSICDTKEMRSKLWYVRH